MSAYVVSSQCSAKLEWSSRPLQRETQQVHDKKLSVSPHTACLGVLISRLVVPVRQHLDASPRPIHSIAPHPRTARGYLTSLWQSTIISTRGTWSNLEQRGGFKHLGTTNQVRPAAAHSATTYFECAACITTIGRSTRPTYTSRPRTQSSSCTCIDDSSHPASPSHPCTQP